MSKKQNKIIAKLQREIEEKQAYCDHHLERRRQAEQEVKELRNDVQAAEKEAERQKSFAQQMAKRNINLDRAFKKYRFAVAHGAGALKLQEIVDELKSTRLPNIVNTTEDSFDCLGPQMAAYHGINIAKTQTIKGGENIPPSMLKEMRDMYDTRHEHFVPPPLGEFKPGKTLEQIAEESGVNKITESDILNLRNCLQIAYKSAGKEDILPEHIKALKDLIAYKDDQLDREINSHQETEIALKKLEGKYAKLERYYATSDLGATSDRELHFTFDTVSLS